jgi:hypothetical protein
MSLAIACSSVVRSMKLWNGAPLTLHRLEVLAPVLEGLAADRLSDEFDCRRGIFDQG